LLKEIVSVTFTVMLTGVELHNPHAVLGLHPKGDFKVIRLWRPGAEKVHIELLGKTVSLERVKKEGLFELGVPNETGPLDYRVYHRDGALAHDPYAFWPTFGEMDAHLFSKGVHYKIYNMMGGRIAFHQGCVGAKFAVWAPNAKTVSLVGDFNHWDGRENPMRSMGACGVWELFVPGMTEGQKYKFEIHTQDGHVKLKSDPYAYFAEVRPKSASRLFDMEKHEWRDRAWMEKRNGSQRPMAIYEVHAGSWRAGLGYRELAHELAAYCKEMGFTHVELLPVTEHPLDESWGYQVTGFYAATSRFGTPGDFQYFVDHMHQEGIGVIVDWVPAHFPTDDYSLAQFDGTYLYEHDDPRKGFHPHWNTYIFNYGRREVVNFLIGSALFWLEKMHIDGLRVDAVASMLYLDYGRKEGEWIPNPYGGRENLEAIEFIKHLNAAIQQYFPGALISAEESTSFPGVTKPLQWQGLGFDLKWNMGWMNDTLRYFHKDPIYRHFHHNDLTFGLIYAFSERFILVLSHDEVVHGKGSLVSKMPGDDWQKFANVRLLYSYMICQPGKKLLFMGGELGQWEEWNCKGEIAWHLLQHERHRHLKKCIQELNHFYRGHPALWEGDFDSSAFEWIDFQDAKNSVISYLRKSRSEHLVSVHNFTPNYFSEYFIRLKGVKEVHEIFNTDREEFGGSGKINTQITASSDGFAIKLAPLATMIIQVVW
jgi:1,4-alpha-glucan branching enzyme